MSNTFKLLHTSDWHLGQFFMGKSRQSEHTQFLSWLIEEAVSLNVDAILVAGDIFDTGSPPSYAREMYNNFIVQLQKTGIHLIILAGNHDSVATLGESKELLSLLNAHVMTSVQNQEDLVITLRDQQQEPKAIICAVPFLRTKDIVTSQTGQTGKDKQINLQKGIQQYYQKVFSIAEMHRVQNDKSLPIIATGHLTTVGAQASESVRDIYIGNLEALPVSAFPNADYVALGHIHRTQRVSKHHPVYYSGSPIALSFDELTCEKNVLLAEFKEGNWIQAKPIPVPIFQEMHLISGDLNEIELAINDLANNNKSKQKIWLEINVITDDFLIDLQERIQLLIEGKPFEVLLLRRARKLSQIQLEKQEQETLQELSPVEVFERRLSLEEWSDQKKRTRMTHLFEAVLQQAELMGEGDSE